MSGAEPKIKYGILCEDVRREDNGKLIVLGMYGRNVELTQFPAAIGVTVLIAMHADAPGSSKIDVAALLDEKELRKASGTVSFDGKGQALLSLPPLLLQVENPGELAFKARLDDGEWAELWRGDVERREPKD